MFLRKFIGSLIVPIVILAFTTSAFGLSDNWYHYEQGMRMIAAKNWDQAQKEFTYYLKLPEIHRHMFGVAHFGRGLLFQTMEQYDKAIAEFRLAIENDFHPEFSVSGAAYTNIGNIYFKRKSYKDAIAAYIKALEKNPGDGLAHYFLCLYFVRTGEYDMAEKESEEAKKLGVPFTALSVELNKIKNSSKEFEN